MGTLLEEFFLKIGWDTSDLKKGDEAIQRSNKNLREDADKTGKRQEQANKRAQQSYNTLKNEIVGVAASFVGASAVKSFVSGLIQTDAAIGRTAATLVTAVPLLSKWQALVQRQNGSPGEADSTFAALIQTYTQAQQGKGVANQYDLARLGLNWTELANPDAVLQKLAAEADRRTAPDDRRSMVASMQAIGIQPAAISVILQGTEALKKQTAAVQANGVATEESAKAARDLENSWAGVTQAAKGAARPLLAPVFDQVAGLLQGDGIDPTKDTGNAIDAAVFPWLATPEQSRQAYKILSGKLGDRLHSYSPKDQANRNAQAAIGLWGGAPQPRLTGLPKDFDRMTAWSSDELATWARQNIRGSRVTSGGRSTAHNAAVGGVGNSQHINDQGHLPTAIDLVAAGFSAAQVAAMYRGAGAPVSLLNEGDHLHVQATRAALAAGARRARDNGGARAGLLASGVDPRYAAMIASGQRAALAPGGNGTTVTIEHIDIHTAATDGPGIARSIGPAVRTALTRQANTGLR